jgi:AraC-like DNA-binding protein
MLMLLESGTCKIICGEDGEPFELKAGEITLLPAGNKIYREAITPLTFYQFAFNTKDDHPFYQAALSGKILLPKEQITAIFQGLKQAYPIVNNSELIESFIGYIFAQNYLFGKRTQIKPKPFSEEVEAAIRYMRNNFDKKIDMDELAERVFLSHTGLIWKFRQELNTTPSNYLYLLRMRYARFLLLDYSYSVSEISEMCGYQNPYYFTNAFRKYSGMSPTKFRNHYLKEKR